MPADQLSIIPMLSPQDSRRRLFIFDGNGRPQIVEYPPEHLYPLSSQCQRAHPDIGCFAIFNNHKIELFIPGGFIRKCEHCNAWLTDFEFNRRGTRGNTIRCKFCSDGRTATDEMRAIFEEYQNIPLYLFHLQDSSHPNYRHYRKESRGYNAQLKFSHFNGGVEMITGGGPTVCRINGELDFTLGDIRPDNDQRPRFGNYYAIDPDTAMDLRSRNEDPRIIDRLNQSLLRAIDQTIREHSWLAQIYRTAGELRKESHQRGLCPPPGANPMFKQRGIHLILLSS